MHFENLIIISNFLDRLNDKYKQLGLIKYRWLTKSNIDDENKIEKEMLRITILAGIEEIQNHFYKIHPQRFYQNGINVVVYCNNQNKHCGEILDIFRDYQYELTIEIYYDDFLPFEKNLFSIINIDELNIFGLDRV